MREPSRRKRAGYIVRPQTALITRGFDPMLSVGSARPAVFRSSTYVFSSPEAAETAFAVAMGKITPADDRRGDLIYSRLAHPNADILEDQIIALEPGASAAAVFNSGMAAITTLFFTVCPPGSSFVYTTPLYGGTYHFIHQLLAPLGVMGIPVPAGNTAKLRRAIKTSRNLSLVFLETPANPTLVMSDIAAAAEAAHGRKTPALVAVDNTLLGPSLQHPLQMGADLSVYSATKYLSGFSDLLAGAILGSNPIVLEDLRGIRAILGNILQPDECWMLDSRLPTVNSRMHRQSKNAQHIVEALAGHKAILKIHYPLLFRDPEQIRIRNAQCRFPGALFSIELAGGKRAAFDFLRHLKVIKNAVSLGGIESLACHSATTTHSEMTPKDLLLSGVNDALVRISVGVEDWRDLLRDINQSLAS